MDNQNENGIKLSSSVPLLEEVKNKKKYLKILFTVVYLFLIPNLIRNLILTPVLLKISVTQNSSGFNMVGITLLLLVVFFIFVAYKLISMIIDGVFIKQTKKIVIGGLLLALVSFPAIFLLKDL